MDASFEVQGKNADELWKRADQRARDFAAGNDYTITRIDADRQIMTYGGERLSYIARVDIEVHPRSD